MENYKGMNGGNDMQEHKAILIELGEDYIEMQKNEMEKWFEHILTAQTALEVMLAKAVPSIREPHIREAIEKIQKSQQHHGESAENLFSIIGRTADDRKDRILGTVLGKVEEALLSFQDFLAGAKGSWQSLHHLLLLNQQAMGAFAVGEQLGLSVGSREVADACFLIVHDKTMHQLLLQEYMLEMAPISILYKEQV